MIPINSGQIIREEYFTAIYASGECRVIAANINSIVSRYCALCNRGTRIAGYNEIVKSANNDENTAMKETVHNRPR